VYRRGWVSVLRHLLAGARRRGDRGDAAAAFRFPKLERGRLLLDLWRTADPAGGRGALLGRADVGRPEQATAPCGKELEAGAGGPGWAERRGELLRRRNEMQLTRDRLFEECLRDRSRRTGAALPALVDLETLQQLLPIDTIYVAASVVGEEVF